MLLLDTCALLWLAAEPEQLSRRAVAAIGRSAGGLFVSAITAFEIARKHRQGKLGLPLPPEEWYAVALVTHGIAEIPLDGRLAARAATLPPIHRDPCDRFIIATAIDRSHAVITADKTIPRYPRVRVVW